MITQSDKENELISKITPILQGVYRAIRKEGISRADSKNVIELALKHAILNECFNGGIDTNDET